MIEISPDVFDNMENFKELNVLLKILPYKRRYNVFVDITHTKEKVVFESLSEADREILELFFNQQITSSQKPNYFIKEKGGGNFCYSINEAVRFFTQPFVIILENHLNDGYFFDSLLKNFKNAGKIISRHKNEGWLEYYNAGGKDNIKNCIEAKLKNFEELEKENFEYLRCFVLTDSDKEFPSQHKEDNIEMINYLKSNRIPFHILEKREMENYLPDEVWDYITATSDFIESYKQLSPIQKDFFNIENGFNKNFKSLDPGVQQLYESLSDSTINILRKGIEMKGKFKSEFPKYFFSEKVTQETLKERTKYQQDPDELSNLLKQISNLL